MNSVQVNGRLTADIELRYGAQSQKAVARFCLANDDGYGERKKTNFIDCVAFDKTAEGMAQYVGKGCRVIVIGRLSTGSYERQDGSKAKTVDVIVDRVEYIDFKDNEQQEHPDFQQLNEDVPF